MKKILFMLVLANISSVIFSQKDNLFTKKIPFIDIKSDKEVLNNKINISQKILFQICDSILTLEKGAIPFLIEEIDAPSIFYGKILHNPYSSNIHIESGCYHFKGILAAYLIEFILERDIATKTIPKYKKDSAILDHSIIDWYFIKGWSNLIINKNNDQALTYLDIIKLKKIYLDWWELNKNKTIDQLRKLQLNETILKNTQFKWI